MGREIRRVPPDWLHPRYTEDNATYSNRVGEYMPMHDEDYVEVASEWLRNCIIWESGQHPDQLEGRGTDCKYYWEYDGGPPEPEQYRPAFTEEPTWFQVYENVSEGTPVTPSFATKEELIDWLVERGEQHGTQYERRYTREQAAAFVEDEYAPSLVFMPGTGVMTGIEAAGMFKKDRSA